MLRYKKDKIIRVDNIKINAIFSIISFDKNKLKKLNMNIESHNTIGPIIVPFCNPKILIYLIK